MSLKEQALKAYEDMSEKRKAFERSAAVTFAAEVKDDFRARIGFDVTHIVPLAPQACLVLVEDDSAKVEILALGTCHGNVIEYYIANFTNDYGADTYYYFKEKTVWVNRSKHKIETLADIGAWLQEQDDIAKRKRKSLLRRLFEKESDAKKEAPTQKSCRP